MLYMVLVLLCIYTYCSLFFVKQKTAYEMRISDWSSDVCSSDLERHRHDVRPSPKVTGAQQEAQSEGSDEVDAERGPREVPRCERRAEAVASQGAGGSCDREQRDLHWGRAHQRMATLCPLRQYEAAIAGVARPAERRVGKEG